MDKEELNKNISILIDILNKPVLTIEEERFFQGLKTEIMSHLMDNMDDMNLDWELYKIYLCRYINKQKLIFILRKINETVCTNIFFKDIEELEEGIKNFLYKEGNKKAGREIYILHKEKGIKLDI